MAEKSLTCVKPSCQFSKDGTCAEGHEPANCPNIVKSSPALDVVKTGSTEIDLRSGDQLNLEGVTDILRGSQARVIVTAGDVNSGKTTLVAALYDKFNEGPYGGLYFAGSKTLAGLERRCYLARVTSGAIKASTERTPISSMGYLHFCFQRQDLATPIQDLIFSDLSGEIFRSARDSTEECKKLTILKRCDHFVLLLDGERLCSSVERQAAFHSGAALLRSCADAGMLGRWSIVHLVISKADLVKNADSPTQDFVGFIQKEFMKRFKDRFGQIHWRIIAARPDDEEVLPFAYGLDGLLVNWLEESLMPAQKPIAPVEMSGLRYFELFA